MEVCIMPISGGGFPIQVAASCMMADVGYKPDLIFASSGGSVCAFIMLAGEWNSLKVPMILENMSSSMFIHHWNLPVVDKIYSLSRGLIFNSGTGGEDFFKNLFDSRKLQGIETWVGAYNIDMRKFKMSTNMSSINSTMFVPQEDLQLNNLCDLAYLDGNISEMARVVSASCSIPGIVPHKCINGHNYVDGGVVCASPIGYFRMSLSQEAEKRAKSIHFTFMTCEDLNARGSGCYKSNPEDDSGGHIVQSIMGIVSNMVNVSLVRDRVVCSDILCSMGSILLGNIVFKVNHTTLEDLKKFKLEYAMDSGSISELYSDNISKYMDMANFDGKACLDHMDKSEKTMMCRLWVFSKPGRSAALTITNCPPLKRLLGVSVYRYLNIAGQTRY